MTINNFDIINKMLSFEKDGDFYFIQILKRKKDNPGMKKDVSLIDNFYIYTQDDLFNLKDKIVKLCNYHNARACIRMNKRNAEKIALQTLKLTTDCIINKDFKGVKSVYASACGQFSSETEKKWIIDIDKPEDKKPIIDFILSLENAIIYDFIPSKSCGHLLVKPFNPNLFTAKFPTVDLHKDSFVNLFIPDNTIDKSLEIEFDILDKEYPELSYNIKSKMKLISADLAKKFAEHIFNVITETEKTGKTWDIDSEYDYFIKNKQ